MEKMYIIVGRPSYSNEREFVSNPCNNKQKLEEKMDDMQWLYPKIYDMEIIEYYAK